MTASARSLSRWTRVIRPVLSLSLLAVVAICTARAEATENILPWPDRAYGRITETIDKGGRNVVLKYGVSYERRESDAVLRFQGVHSMTVNGQLVEPVDLPSGPLFQPDLTLDLEGQVIGLLEPELFESVHDALSRSMERIAKNKAQREAARAMRSESGRSFVRDQTQERYLHWMLPYLYRPEPGANTAAFEVESDFFGLSLPLQIHTQTETTAEPEELEIQYRGVRDATGRGNEMIAAMQAFARSAGIEPGKSKDAPGNLNLRFTDEIHSVFARQSMLPQRVSVTSRVSSDDKTPQAVRRQYRFEWSEQAPPPERSDSVVILRPPNGSEESNSDGNNRGDLVHPLPSPTANDGREASFKRRQLPRYPPRAIRELRQGEALVQVRVTGDGRAHDVAISISSGHSDLDEAAIESIEKSTFNPEVREGKAVESVYLVPVTFSLIEG